MGDPNILRNLAAYILDDIRTRTNNANLNALLGVTDAAGRSIFGNLGDFQARTNLQTLLAMLGLPDDANGSLYARLGAFTSAAPLKTDVTTILTRTGYINDAACPADPTAGSINDVLVEDIYERTNTKTLHGLLGVTDAAGSSIGGNLGDFQARTNLQSLLAVLGIPDDANGSLYTRLGAYTSAASLKTAIDLITTRIGTPPANLVDIVTMLGNPNIAGHTVYDNLGDFVAQTSLTSLLLALGIPDVAGKDLYTCLITDRLDNAGFGLSNLKTLIDAIQTDLGDPSTRTNLKTILALIGLPDDANGSLYDRLSAGYTTAAPLKTSIDAIVSATAATFAGAPQTKSTTIELNQIAGNYTLFTGAGQRVVVDQLIITMPNAVAGGALTSISIQTNDATAQTFITNVQGAVANLTAENQLFTNDPISIGVGKLIQLTINGGATGAGYVCTVEVLYHAVTTGGSLT
jgi:hypothetical protein